MSSVDEQNRLLIRYGSGVSNEICNLLQNGNYYFEAINYGFAFHEIYISHSDICCNAISFGKKLLAETWVLEARLHLIDARVLGDRRKVLDTSTKKATELNF